jgi:ABC-type nickel/cobalt efflux system permease component RcnA
MEVWLGFASTVMLVAMAGWYLWRVATWRPSR